MGEFALGEVNFSYEKIYEEALFRGEMTYFFEFVLYS